MNKTQELISKKVEEYYQLCQERKHKGKILAIHTTGDYGKTKIIKVRYVFRSGGGFCYSTRTNARRGWLISRLTINRIAIIEDKKTKNINKPLTWEKFWKKIDSRFMSEAKAMDIWQSGIDGAQVSKWNFRRITGKGRRLMDRFLERFESIDKITPHYYKSSNGEYKILNETSPTWRHTGRDLSISHQTNIECVFWSSEYAGCGNGAYYIVANEKEVIFLEYD